MLTSTFDSSLSSYLSATLSNYKPHNIYAAKSGTTNSDSYVIAYNPNFTIGIWAGTDSNVSLTNYTLSKQLFKEISIILEKEKEPSWYNTNYHTEALRYKRDQTITRKRITALCKLDLTSFDTVHNHRTDMLGGTGHC